MWKKGQDPKDFKYSWVKSVRVLVEGKVIKLEQGPRLVVDGQVVSQYIDGFRLRAVKINQKIVSNQLFAQFENRLVKKAVLKKLAFLINRLNLRLCHIEPFKSKLDLCEICVYFVFIMFWFSNQIGSSN